MQYWVKRWLLYSRIVECFESELRHKANAEIAAENAKLVEITQTTQAANSDAKEEVAFSSKQVCITCMHYLSIVEANVNFR